MVKRFSRVFVLLHVVGDIACAATAFVLAYLIRFESGLLDIPKGQPPFDQYLAVLPFVAVMVPIAFHIQRLYRFRRGRTRLDDFFAVLVGSLLTVLLACFGRAVSEVGAVMIVGGNIEGFTRVMTTAIALETSKGDLPLALGLGIVLLAVVLLLNSLVALLRRWREHLDGGDLRMATT